MKAGDHIRITTGGVSQDAIDLGDRTVIHFVKGEGVKRSRLDQLAPNGARVEVVNHRHRVYAPKHVVARAFSRFSEAAYSAMFHGSEEFASWCKTGRVPARPFAVPAVAISPELAPRASAGARPAKVRRSPPRAARPAARPAARKPAARKAAKTAAAPAKAARAVKKAPPARRPAKAKPASAAKRPARPSPAPKRVRASAPAAKPARPAKARKQLAPAASARPSKRSTPAAASKQKRGKAPGKRAAAGR